MGGQDKPLLTVGGEPILARIIRAMDLPDLAISANGDPARFAAFGRPVLDDGAFMDQGPLAGVLAGMTWAAALGADLLLTVPGDTPFIPRGLARDLAPAPACAASLGRAHHLVALWPVAAAPALRALLSRDVRRDVAGFARSIGMRRVDFPAAPWDPFVNVNTPDDLERARSLAMGMENGA